jgi:hypothetical protein
MGAIVRREAGPGPAEDVPPLLCILYFALLCHHSTASPPPHRHTQGPQVSIASLTMLWNQPSC